MRDFPFSQVMEVYTESNMQIAREQWPEEGEFQGLYRAEQDFYQYLRQDFFTTNGAFYDLWMDKGRIVSAVRFEPWKDGYLLEGLETHPDYRGRGYAGRLMEDALQQIHATVYSHVARDNEASLRVHAKCGFLRCRDSALINGSYDPRFVTLKIEKSHG